MKIAINVYGGMVQSVYATEDVEVTVFDEDCEEYTEADAVKLDAIIASDDWKQVW